MEDLFEWIIAVKEIESLPSSLKKELLSHGCEIMDEKVFLHVHLHIPSDYYTKAEELLRERGFILQSAHPATCFVGEKAGFDIFEKRVPIIEARENDTMQELLSYGILMSGGAGKPHAHISIPAEKRETVIKLLQEQSYYPR